MTLLMFASNILAGKPIPVFNNGNMRRDFTYIDDIVAGVLGVLSHPFATPSGEAPWRLYNIGGNQTETLMDYIGEIEKALGKKAVYDFLPMQPGDVPETSADVESSIRDFGYSPSTSIREGIPKFIEWYKGYHGVNGHYGVFCVIARGALSCRSPKGERITPVSIHLLIVTRPQNCKVGDGLLYP